MLSLTAADILWEHLELGARPFPLELPHSGATVTERAAIARTTFEELAARGLADQDGPVPWLSDALAALVSFDLGLTVYGALGAGRILRARATVSGDLGVLAAQDEELTVVLIDPADMVGAILDLVPNTRPIPGQPVAVPRDRRESGRSAEDRAVRAMLDRPRLRAGLLGIEVRGQQGTVLRSPELAWFDTDAGRFLVHTAPGPGGEDWTSYSPSDNVHLGHALTELFDSLRPRTHATG
jgi:hypothetical protein